MADRTIHGKGPAYSASAAIEALARALGEIKAEDRLTWADVGAILGVSEDQAAKYADGTATMNAVTFGRGKREWNGRFTGYFDRLCEDSRPGRHCDRSSLTAVLDAAACLSKSLEDGEITASEVHAHRTELEAARDALEAQLGKMRLVS